jgi:outer membrane protein assembly factor BamB
MLYVRPYLFLVTEAGLARCIKAATGEVMGEARLKGKVSTSPVWADGRIYFLSEEGVTTITETGPELKIVNRCELGEKCCASPAISQGQIFIRTENNLYCIGTSL